MHAKNLPHNTQIFAAQAKIKGSARAKTKKVWQNARNAGQSHRKRVYVLICACVLLLCLIGAQIYAFLYMHKQRTGVFSGTLPARKCHQGRFTQKATTEVSVPNTCNTIIDKLGNKLQQNTQNQCEGNFASRKVYGRAAICAAQKSQKPSTASGVRINRRTEMPTSSKASKGLITPEKNQANERHGRLHNIRRLVAKLRQRLAFNLRFYLLFFRSCRSTPLLFFFVIAFVVLALFFFRPTDFSLRLDKITCEGFLSLLL